MELTGIYIKNLERLAGLEREIKYFELDRIENDIRNVHKLDPLYDIYIKLKSELSIIP